MVRVKRFINRIKEIEEKILQDKIEKIQDLQKVEILAGIIHNGGGILETSHFSSGSTVTREGLEYACFVNKIPFSGGKNKKNYLRIMLNSVGEELLDDDFNDNGSTVKTKALIRIYRNLIMTNL
tara:strand:- start:499 stop:870 length:372 start_codon:yes stop_codon:yes gene_type:complete